MKKELEKAKSALIIGKVDSGKTKGILFEQVQTMIEHNENILIVDSKEEYYQRFSKELKKLDYNTIVINLKDATKSNNYNPYSLPLQYYESGETDMAISLIQDMGRELFSEPLSTDPFWEISASNLFTGMSLLTFEEAKKEEINLGSTSICIDLLSKKYEYSNLITMYLEKLSPTNLIYNCVSEIVFAAAETKGSILAVTGQKIKVFTLKEQLLKLLSSTNFELENLGKEKTAIFIITSEENTEVNKVANILIKQVYHLIVKNKLPFNFILDNIETLEGLFKLKTLIDMALDNFKLLIATRSYGELVKVYGESTFANLTGKYTVDNGVKIDSLENTPLDYPKTEDKITFFNAEECLINIIQSSRKPRFICTNTDEEKGLSPMDITIKKIDASIERLEKEERKIS